MDENNKRKNMILTNKIARKAFCVGGLFYPIVYLFFAKILNLLPRLPFWRETFTEDVPLDKKSCLVIFFHIFFTQNLELTNVSFSS